MIDNKAVFLVEILGNFNFMCILAAAWLYVVHLYADGS